MQYEEFKKRTIENQPRKITTALVSVKVVSATVLEIEGEKLAMSASGFESLIAFLQITKRTLVTLNASLGKTRTEQLVAILCRSLNEKGLLREVQRKVKSKDDFGDYTETAWVSNRAVFIVGKNTGKIEKVMSVKHNNKTPAARFFRVVQTAIRRHQLDVIDMAANEKGEIIINAVSPVEKVTVTSSRVYSVGLQMESSVEAMTIRPFFYREKTGERIAFNSKTDNVKLDSDLELIGANVEDIVARKFVSELTRREFAYMLVEATKVRASLAEQRDLYKRIIDACVIKNNEQVNALVGRFVEFSDARRKYDAIGVDLNKATIRTLQRKRSSQSLASVVCGVGVLAGCLPGSGEVYEVIRLSLYAGRTLMKEHWDMRADVPDLLADPDVRLPKMFDDIDRLHQH